MSAPRSAVTISVPYEIDTLDPHARGWAGAMAISANFYEPLVTIDAAMQLRPCLAESWDSPDPLTWVFHLRRGVRFHSGRPLRAADVVYSLNRLRDDRSLALGDYVFDLADIRAIDTETVRVTTRRPITILIPRLPYVLIVPEGATAAEMQSHENGTGPYTLAAWIPGRRLELRRNERYWGTAPSMTEVAYLLGRTSDGALSDLLGGESQLAQLDSRTATESATATGMFRVVRRTSFFVTFLVLNVGEDIEPFCSVRPNPLRDSRVRRAIDLAIDRGALSTEAADGAMPASQLVPPFVFGFNPALAVPARDPALARRLLRDAGFPSGFTVTLHSRRLMAEIAAQIRRMLGEVGVRVEIRVPSDPAFFELVAKHQPALSLNRFACDTGDASEALDQIVHTSAPVARLGESNRGNFSDRALDTLIEKSDGLEEAAARDELLRKIMARVADERPVIPISIGEDVFAVRREIAWTPRGDSDIRAAEISFVPPSSGR